MSKEIPIISFSKKMMFLNDEEVFKIKPTSFDNILFYLRTKKVEYTIYSRKVYKEILRWQDERN